LAYNAHQQQNVASKTNRKPAVVYAATVISLTCLSVVFPLFIISSVISFLSGGNSVFPNQISGGIGLIAGFLAIIRLKQKDHTSLAMIPLTIPRT
jgi:asparagine N-glycosylation enzyme membrane subunit Stt3